MIFFCGICVIDDPESCILTAERLDTADLPVRTLTAQEGLFYAGLLNAVTPPDLYSIVLHGERASRPNIYSREEILKDTVSEVFSVSGIFSENDPPLQNLARNLLCNFLSFLFLRSWKSGLQMWKLWQLAHDYVLIGLSKQSAYTQVL